MGKTIKKSVSLSVFEGTSTSPMLFMGDVEENISRIARLGYDGVDLFLLDAYADETRKAIRLLRQYNLGIGTIMPAGMAAQGLFLGDKSEKIRKKIIEKLKSIIEIAAETDAMVSLGLIRGSAKTDDTVEDLLSRFADSIEKILNTSEKYGVPLLLEPINRYEINNLNSSLEALSFIQRTKLPVYLMLDTFHMNIEDVSMEESFYKCKDYIRHIHFVDSNRLAPGMGHLDMLKLLKIIKEINYSGYLCIEALRKPDSITVAKKGIDFFVKAGI